MAESIFGRGPAYPFRLNKSGTAPHFTEEEERVRESIRSIMCTDITERPFRIRNGVPYGTRIQRLAFEHMTLAVDVAEDDTRRALDAWEPRIFVTDVSVTPVVEKLPNVSYIAVHVFFRFRATNRSDNFVIPYRTQKVVG